MGTKPGRKPKKIWWTVLLMRPDYVCDENYWPTNMFMEHAFAVNAADAVCIVRKKAVKSDTFVGTADDDTDATDYAVVVVIKGRHYDKSGEAE